MKRWNPGLIGFSVIGGDCSNEKDLDLSPVLQIVQKIRENYCPYLYLLAKSSGSVSSSTKVIQNYTLAHVLILIVMS